MTNVQIILYPIGKEPPEIRKKIDALFAKLDEAYPDKALVQLGKNHGKWAERASEIAHALGYTTGSEFLAAYGYTIVQGQAGRRSNSGDEYAAIIEVLKQQCANGAVYGKLNQVIAANPQFASKFKTMNNSANKLFGMPFSKYLEQEGILQKTAAKENKAAQRVEEAALLADSFKAMLSTLHTRPKANTYANLRAENSDLELAQYEPYIKLILKKAPGDFYKENGFVGAADFKITDKGLLSKYQGVGSVVHIPESVVKLSKTAFDDPSQITELVIPGSLKIIPEHYFENFPNLTTLRVAEGVGVLEPYCFAHCHKLTTIELPHTLVMTDIGVFADCTALQSVTLPSSLVLAGQDMFAGCTALQSVTLENGITHILQGMFSDCPQLTEVIFPDTLAVVEEGAFGGTTTYQPSLPKNVSRIARTSYGFRLIAKGEKK